MNYQSEIVEKVKDRIYVSYANLAMAHSAVKNKQNEYEQLNSIICTKLLKGLQSGTMNMRTIFDDEKVKLQTGQICNYCGSNIKLSLDHIFPQKFGGKDDAENLIFACKTCNSSKGKKDLMEWMIYRNEFLPLMVIRRYIKLVYKYSAQNDLLDNNLKDLENMELPFKIQFLPTEFPKPKNLILNITEKGNV
ncbi:HNH endonuclease [Flavobacterium psychrophilum]|uniref:HNH endonuclease n=1 Tax=Flavobacterium psychrophilum TaxID=96345 RepID=UPI002C3C4800|nr:HNH endonuclease [Flavobacterium psychrophilum]MEB3387761.1 HNH endonuclease [Flavobacterium psychrophilum]